MVITSFRLYMDQSAALKINHGIHGGVPQAFGWNDPKIQPLHTIHNPKMVVFSINIMHKHHPAPNFVRAPVQIRRGSILLSQWKGNTTGCRHHMWRVEAHLKQCLPFLIRYYEMIVLLEDSELFSPYPEHNGVSTIGRKMGQIFLESIWTPPCSSQGYTIAYFSDQ